MSHFFGDDVPVLYRGFMALTRCEVEPHVRQYEALRYAFAVALHHAEVVLCIRIALLRERFEFLAHDDLITLDIDGDTILNIGLSHRCEPEGKSGANEQPDERIVSARGVRMIRLGDAHSDFVEYCLSPILRTCS